jgi:hypothetical protein
MEKKSYLTPDQWHDPLINPAGHPADEKTAAKTESEDWFNTASEEQKPKDESDD